MNPTLAARRHPLTACAIALAALLAAGCGHDGGPAGMQNAPLDPSYAPGPGNSRGNGWAPGPGAAQSGTPGNGYAQIVPRDSGAGRSYASPPRAAPEPGYGAGTGDSQRSGNTERMGGGRSSGALDELMNWERQDLGVRPTRELHAGAMHGPTPNQIPGGQVITTKGLVPLLQQGIPVFMFDVLGTAQTLPEAIPAVWAAEPGDFEDETQQQLARMLQQVTRGNPDAALVFYCQGRQCWMSYNAALRSIALGYRNVFWYRGGMEAWNHAGLQFVPAQRQG